MCTLPVPKNKKQCTKKKKTKTKQQKEYVYDHTIIEFYSIITQIFPI